MSSAQASFYLEFPDISSITQLRRTLAGVGVYLRRTGANLLFGHRAGWLELDQARSKKVGKRESRHLPETALKHSHLPSPGGCWGGGGGHVKLHIRQRLGCPRGPGSVSPQSGERHCQQVKADGGTLAGKGK